MSTVDKHVTTYRSPLLTRPGAVEASGPDAGVALHYGAPVHEQRALARGDGVADLSHLGVVTVSGPDRISWLNTLSSQLLLGLEAGVSTELLLLDVNGHIEHAPAVQDDGERTWLITEAADAAPLAQYLDKMRFMLRVEVERRDDVAVLGTAAGGWLELATDPAHLLTWQDPWPRTAPGSTAYGPQDADHPGIDIHRALSLVRRAALDEVVTGFLTPARDGDDVTRPAPSRRLAGTWAWEALRVEAWRPRLATEVDARTIPHELDWLRTGAHLDKGCYRGQETVARVVNLGRPPRRLVMLHLDGSDHLLPDAGAEVRHGDKVVGRLTSVVRHEELGPIGLAVVKRSVAGDADLDVGGVAAAQEIVVGLDGVTDARPAERPGAGLRRRDLRR
ncbi:YgfZ/GcvT domain-containing protein [Georgenia yuyongxinii]|uniref:Folate-binding protein YgfZ n=1 Tax=Georgenia yuyongxinii TaxID=2589797 RepID=A0A552WN35_9MICO|nr:glycine cleavage T C-terminal barrel domain-containing protein [Georgenia yuyongxinii]TRW43999.1 folate-binding protein YgfZ [Georgenia yuyongxinii]